MFKYNGCGQDVHTKKDNQLIQDAKKLKIQIQLTGSASAVACGQPLFHLTRRSPSWKRVDRYGSPRPLLLPFQVELPSDVHALTIPVYTSTELRHCFTLKLLEPPGPWTCFQNVKSVPPKRYLDPAGWPDSSQPPTWMNRFLVGTSGRTTICCWKQITIKQNGYGQYVNTYQRQPADTR
jgi:hypothetical protein